VAAGRQINSNEGHAFDSMQGFVGEIDALMLRFQSAVRAW